MSRRLQILSASFTSLASLLRLAACSTCRRLRSAFGSDLSSVTSATMRAIFPPKAFSSSSCVVAVSSTVSCSSAAQSTSTSVTPPSLISTSASAIGWLMYGEDSASLRRWSRCLCAAKASALSSKARSPRSAPLFMENPLEDQQRRTDRDGGIGEVERRPMPAQGVEIEEIDHLAEAQPVDDVAERPAQDQRQPGARHRSRRRAQKERADDDGGCKAPRRRRPGGNASSARICGAGSARPPRAALLARDARGRRR